MKCFCLIFLSLCLTPTAFAQSAESAKANLLVGVVTAEYSHTDLERRSVENILPPGAPRSQAYTYFEIPIKRYKYLMNGAPIRITNAVPDVKKMYALMPLLESGTPICAILRPRPANDWLAGYYDILDYDEVTECPVAR